jgi:hypothetical protein
VTEHKGETSLRSDGTEHKGETNLRSNVAEYERETNPKRCKNARHTTNKPKHQKHPAPRTRREQRPAEQLILDDPRTNTHKDRLSPCVVHTHEARTPRRRPQTNSTSFEAAMHSAYFRAHLSGLIDLRSTLNLRMLNAGIRRTTHLLTILTHKHEFGLILNEPRQIQAFFQYFLRKFPKSTGPCLRSPSWTGIHDTQWGGPTRHLSQAALVILLRNLVNDCLGTIKAQAHHKVTIGLYKFWITTGRAFTEIITNWLPLDHDPTTAIYSNLGTVHLAALDSLESHEINLQDCVVTFQLRDEIPPYINNPEDATVTDVRTHERRNRMDDRAFYDRSWFIGDKFWQHPESDDDDYDDY